MHDLVEMIKDDLVMMEVQLNRCYKKGLNVVGIYHSARLSVGRVVELLQRVVLCCIAKL